MGFDEILARAWPTLLEAIRQRRTITYTELAGRIGPPATARAIHRQLLRPLSARCERWGLPDLPALVVRKGSGVPGGGWFDPPKPGEPESPLARWEAELGRCFDHAWDSRVDPRLLIDPERKHVLRLGASGQGRTES